MELNQKQHHVFPENNVVKLKTDVVPDRDHMVAAKIMVLKKM